MDRKQLRLACDRDAASMRIRARIHQPHPERTFQPQPQPPSPQQMWLLRRFNGLPPAYCDYRTSLRRHYGRDQSSDSPYAPS
jgi:hypothetical protein